MYRKFKPLNIPDGWEQYWSKYPNGYTILEALIGWVSQVDDMVKNQNELTDTVKSFGERIDDFINQFGVELQATVTDTLQEWQNSGFLEVVISEAIQWELDDYITTNEQDKLSLTTQLQHMNKNIIYIESVPRVAGETDDSGRLQRAIESFEGNFAGTIVITGDIVLDNPVTCHKSGLRLMGVGNKKSRIIVRHGGIGLYVKPLFSGDPYTSVPYCKFFIEDLAIVAEGDACESGTGLFMQWIFASSFRNLYTSGFKEHIVMKGCHLNTFFNLYQGNVDSTERSIEIHNRGVGLSFDASEDETGESTSNNNTILGGWINNTTIDLSGATETVIKNVDFEPTSNSLKSGNRNTFLNCRFERMDLYAVVDTLYPRFPWIIVGDECKFENNTYHNSGPNNAHELNPIFLVNGKNNVIHIPETISFNIGFLTFGVNAEQNVIYDNSTFVDYTKINYEEFRSEYNMYQLNGKRNTIIHVDNTTNNRVVLNGDYLKGTGQFSNVSSLNDNLQYADAYLGQGVTINTIDIPLPFSRAESKHFAKLTKQNDGSGLNRFILSPGVAQKAQKNGVYTFSAVFYIPTNSSCYVTFGPYLDGKTEFRAKGIWTCVQSRRFFKKGEQIIPTIYLNGNEGNVAYVGEISVTEGNNGLFLGNDTQTTIHKMI